MKQAWFLDLDGVRSGPYQTAEVLSLIAEGEVLPHHQISTGLKGQEWRSILDWRLEQNEEPPQEIPIIESTIPEVPVIPEAPAPSISNPEPMIPAAEPVVSVHSDPPPKRDPTSEMFEILQHTKKKRESKSSQAAQQTTPVHTAPEPIATPKKSFSLWNTLFMGASITVTGFYLGQIFQNKANPPVSNETKVAEAEKKVTPTPSPAKPTPARQIIDRSNDKITIQSRPEPPEKENEELQGLKKELQELRDLKADLKQQPDVEYVQPEAENPNNRDAEGNAWKQNNGNNGNNGNNPDVHD